MNIAQIALLGAGVGLLSVGVANAAPRVTLSVGEATVRGRTVAVTGDAKGLPDGTKVHATIGFEGKRGVEKFGVVTADAYSVTFGDGKRKLLPGTYHVLVRVDHKTQKKAVAAALKGFQVIDGKGTFQVGTPAEAKAERVKVREKYEFFLGALQAVHGNLGMYGSSTVSQAAIEKVRGKGKVPKAVQRNMIQEWGRFSAQYREEIPTIRFDLKQFSQLLLVSYFPEAHDVLGELLVTMDRAHASYTVVIYKNLGAEPPKEAAKMGKFNLGQLTKKMPTLADRCYKLLGVPSESWRLIDANNPENPEDSKQGDYYRSTVAKFEITKPGGEWIFDPAPASPTLRVRIRHKDPTLTKKVVSGVELRDYPTAENMGDLARLDENWTRGHWPGFELVKSKRIKVQDTTMEGGMRPGQVMHYRFSVGKDKDKNDIKYFVVQYALFCRWHKRTYTVMSFVQDGLEKDWMDTFDKINESFAVLDKPGLKKKLEAEDKKAAEKEAKEKADAAEADKDSENGGKKE